MDNSKISIVSENVSSDNIPMILETYRNLKSQIGLEALRNVQLSKKITMRDEFPALEQQASSEIAGKYNLPIGHVWVWLHLVSSAYHEAGHIIHILMQLKFPHMRKKVFAGMFLRI